jgi:hypothetical protein
MPCGGAVAGQRRAWPRRRRRWLPLQDRWLRCWKGSARCCGRLRRPQALATTCPERCQRARAAGRPRRPLSLRCRRPLLPPAGRHERRCAWRQGGSPAAPLARAPAFAAGGGWQQRRMPRAACARRWRCQGGMAGRDAQTTLRLHGVSRGLGRGGAGARCARRNQASQNPKLAARP